MNAYVGKSCPYCKTAIKDAEEEIKVCGVCGMPHHSSCWEENQGCTTFGCTAHNHTNQPSPMQSPAYQSSLSYQPKRRQPISTYLKSIRTAAKTDIAVAIPFWFFVIGAILTIVGLVYPVPSREFSFYAITEYVGGDAYNASIEAAIRGGEIAGAQMAKAMYICGGVILTALSIYKIQSVHQFEQEA
jgi:hypothetical protein